MPRVREIIRLLDYDSLVRKGIIPDDLFETSVPKGKYPPLFPPKEKDRDYARIGVFLDELSQVQLSSETQQEWSSRVYPLYCEVWGSKGKLSSEEVMKVMGFFTNMYKFLRDDLLPYSPRFQNELTYDRVEGHPDVLTDDAILDFKTTADFSKMRKETILQLLSYHALNAVSSEVRIDTIGVVFLLQRRIITEVLTLERFDAYGFAKVLCDAVPRVEANTLSFWSLTALVRTGEIGHHMSKPKFIKSLLDEKSSLPNAVQIFSRSPRGKGDSAALSEDEIETYAQIAKDRGARIYIHAPYWINLSHPRETKGRPSSLDVLKSDLELGRNLGARGVVVHVGKALNTPIDRATDVMYESVIECLESATEECPLLLETAAGQGSELLWRMKDLAAFWSRFDENEKKKFGLCVDSCHVFASGYDPYAVLVTWTKYFPGSVKLIHFNGSRGIKGCRVDRHSYFDDKLPAERLMLVYRFARENDIPMVLE